MSVDMLFDTRNMFDGMTTAIDDERANRVMQSIIFVGYAVDAGGATVAAGGYDPEETQNEDDQGSFMLSTYDQVGMHSKLWRHSRSNVKASPSTFLIIRAIKDEEKFKA
ncbi:hypothetical protein D1007_32168 [Hordeum vulgare]|nr:hypothetical protein D1007_32168 [Hordeum vulgare]